MIGASVVSRRQAIREVDVIIVGGGTAGALVARRLAACTDADILVMEAGPAFPRWALGVPLASYRLRRPWSWDFRSVPQEALGGRRILFPMGRVLGGSSAVNAMIAAHGPAADYDAWEAEGCVGWSWNDLLPCWRRVTGPRQDAVVSIERPSFTAPFTTALVEACVEYGLEHVDALTGEQAGTCGAFALFQRHGRRCTTAEALAGAGTGCRVAVSVRTGVRRILVENDRAVGVECGDPRGGFGVRARMGVVLSAGVFGTPTILMRSGIGPTDRLRAAGIDVRCQLPGVGGNLHDHVGVPVIWGSRAPSPGRKSRWLPAAVEYALWRTGVMASNGCEGGAFLGPVGHAPDLEIAAMFQSRFARGAVEMSAIVMHPESRGFVTVDPRDPLGPPIIEPRFLSASVDVRRLREGVERIREIASQPSLRAFGLTRELMPGSTDPALHIRQHATTHYHPVGTCRMGTDGLAVVDPGLAVHGLRNLWVCDNSVIPRLPAGHSAATAMIVAERGADLIARQMAAP
jgi:choline dehydrogenase